MTIKILPALTNFVRPSAHSTFSPSAADAWLACPARRRLIQNIPEETSVYAEEGTLAHSVCEAFFRKEFYDIPFPNDLNLKMAMLTDQGLEMMSCAQGYYYVLSSWLNDQINIGEVLWFGLEKGIPVFAEQGCFGTADCLIVGTKGAAVIDYKHGKGKNVSATSLQLKVYLSGIFKHLTNIPEDYLFHAVVYQPRTEEAPKHTSYMGSDLADFLKQIEQAIQKSSEVNAEAIEGSHCFWCPARRTNNVKLKCPVILEKPLKLAQENFGKFLSDMNMPSVILNNQVSTPKRDEAMMKIISLFPLIKSVAEDAEQEFLYRMSNGESIEGLMVVDKIGNRKINGEGFEEQEKLLKTHFPNVEVSETVTTTKIKTLAKLEKLVGKEKLNLVCTRPIKKEIKVLDEKIRSVLGEMAVFGSIINRSEEGKEEV